MHFCFSKKLAILAVTLWGLYVLIHDQAAFCDDVAESQIAVEKTSSSPESAFRKASQDPWELKMTPYGFPSEFKGDSTLDGFTTPELKANLIDILELLDFAASGRAELWHNRWGVIVDAYYVEVGKEFDTKITIPPGTFIQGRTVTIPGRRFRPERTIIIPPGPGLDVPGPQVDLSARLEQYDLAGSYRFSFDAPSRLPGKTLSIEPILGLRLGQIRQAVDLTPGAITGLLGAPGRELGGSKTYVEPFLGSNVEYRLSKRLSVSVRGDIGGFGIGNASHCTWNLVSLVGIHLKENLIFKLGYAIKDINYETGSGRSAFGLDTKLKGPWIGLTIKL